jgi:serine/threonine protein kinase/tetratricopeptide (TPR) repeat protein
MIAPLSLGPFVLQEEIGRGGMARVFAAYHETDGTPVAVKLMSSELEEAPEGELEVEDGTAIMGDEAPDQGSEFAEAFGFEVRAAAQLDHPCVTTVYDHGFVREDEATGPGCPAGAPWLAMELVNGGTLSDDRSPRRWAELRRITLDVLDGLAHAHARGLVHRDIKPGNVLIDGETGRSKLADFGLAHSIQGERKGALADTSNVVGTPAFMAPEQIEARWQDYGPWTDLYAVGAMVWTLCTGRPPYRGEVTEVLESHLRGVLPDFKAQHPMPEGLLTWIRGMMHPMVTGRFQRAADAAWSLCELADSDQPEGPTPDAATPASGALQTLVVGAGGPTMAAVLAKHLRPNTPPPAHAYIGHALMRAPMPEGWRAPRQPRRHLHGAGLALFEHRSTGLVGRGEERDRLWSALHKVSSERALSVVVLEGASGTGKSTLARWLVERSDEVGAGQHLAITHSAAGGANEGIAAMLTRHFRIQEFTRAGAVDRVARCLAQLGVDDREEAIALTELARPSTDEESQATGLGVRFSGPRERHVLLARYLGYLAHIRPLILWLDELIHGDDTRAFANFLLKSEPRVPVLMVTTVASEVLAEHGEGHFGALLNHARSEQLTLAPLNREEQSALVRELLGLEPTLAAQVESRSGGNPLFAVQLVSDWIQRGLLVTGAEGFRLAEGADARMPDNLAQVWRQRVEQLFAGRGEGEIHAIEVAAMLGQDVHREEWEDVCSAAEIALPKALLSELMRRRLVTSHGEYLGWSFAHAMLHEAVMEHAVEAGRQRRWASLCADALHEGTQTIVRRARYLLLADRTKEAITPLHRAIQREIGLGELARAIELLALREEAIARLEVDPADPRALRGEILANALERTGGDIEQARRRAEMTLRRARATRDAELIAEALHGVATTLAHLGELESAQSHMEEAMTIAQQLRLPIYVRMCTDVCFVYMRQGALDKCAERAREVIFAGEALGEPGYVAKGYGLLARVSRQAGRVSEAEFFLEEARLRCERGGDRNGQAIVYNTLGELKREAGQLEEAEQKIPEMGLVDVDIANLAQLAAERCDALGHPSLAHRCWVIAHDQWTALHRSAETAVAAKHLAV